MQAIFSSSKKNQQWLQSFAVTVGAIILSLLVSAILIAAFGYNPIEAYAALLEGAFGSSTAVANMLSKSVPLIFTGLAFMFALKGGIFNIGGEGQLYAGAMVAALISLGMDGMPKYLVIICSIGGGMLGGACVGALTGLIKAKVQVSEVIVAIMLNYIVLYFTSFLVSYPFKEEGAMTPQSNAIDEKYMLTKLIPKTQLTTAILIAVVISIVLVFFFKKTRAGFNIRAVGENGHAALASGIPMVSTAILTMAASGGLAGLAGVTEVLGKNGRFIDGFSSGYGFTGIAVAVLAKNNPVGIIFSALLFGVLEAGAMKMSYAAGISTSIINVIQGLVILFVATPNIIQFMFKKKEGVQHG